MASLHRNTPELAHRDNAPSSADAYAGDADWAASRPSIAADTTDTDCSDLAPIPHADATYASIQQSTSFSDLPAEVLLHIATFLPPNDTPCCLRPAARATAAALPAPNHATVSPNLPTAPFAFMEHWEEEFGPQGMAALTIGQRRKLLTHTARSGVPSNLDVMLNLAGCTPTPEVLAAAAATGSYDTCAVLLPQADSCKLAVDGSIMAAAAASGSLELCETLVAWRPTGLPGLILLMEHDGGGLAIEAAKAAARHGHRHVCEWALHTVWKRRKAHAPSSSLLALVGMGWGGGAWEAGEDGEGSEDEDGREGAGSGDSGAGPYAAGAAAAPTAVLCSVAAEAVEGAQVPLLRWLLPLLCARVEREGAEVAGRSDAAAHSLARKRIRETVISLRSVMAAAVAACGSGRMSYDDAVWVREQLAAAAAAGPGEVVGALAEEGWSTGDIVAAVVGVSAVAVQVEAEGGSGAGAGGGEAVAAAGGRLRLEVTWPPEHRQAGAAADEDDAEEAVVNINVIGDADVDEDAVAVAAAIAFAVAALDIAGDDASTPPQRAAGRPLSREELDREAAMQAAREGHVGALEAMRAAGRLQGAALGGVAVEGAKGGHVGVVEWAWRALAEGMLARLMAEMDRVGSSRAPRSKLVRTISTGRGAAGGGGGGGGGGEGAVAKAGGSERGCGSETAGDQRGGVADVRGSGGAGSSGSTGRGASDGAGGGSCQGGDVEGTVLQLDINDLIRASAVARRAVSGGGSGGGAAGSGGCSGGGDSCGGEISGSDGGGRGGGEVTDGGGDVSGNAEQTAGVGTSGSVVTFGIKRYQEGIKETCAEVAELAAAKLVLTEAVMAAAAGSGSVALVAWLRERGCPWGPRCFVAAAESGCVQLMEWMAERGCPMGSDGLPYTHAVRNGDTATLRCLAGLGCPGWEQQQRRAEVAMGSLGAEAVAEGQEEGRRRQQQKQQQGRVQQQQAQGQGQAEPQLQPPQPQPPQEGRDQLLQSLAASREETKQCVVELLGRLFGGA